MTRNEFIAKIENGRDVLFTVAGKGFTILTWPAEGIAIGDWSRPNDKPQFFQTAQELVDNFMVHNVPLKDLVHKIVITEYS